jgi:hypothetical protein
MRRAYNPAFLNKTGGEEMKYLIVAVLVGGLSIAGLLAQKSDQPKTPATNPAQTSTTDQSKAAPSGPQKNGAPVAPSKSKNAKKSKKSAVAEWGVCQLPPKTTQYSFYQTCTGVALDSNTCIISASCKMMNGQPRAATFDTHLVPSCPSDFFAGKTLYNNNGYMCCNYAGQPTICGN